MNVVITCFTGRRNGMEVEDDDDGTKIEEGCGTKKGQLIIILLR